MKHKITMKEMPPGERPYEKCQLNGPGVLSDAELLAVILRNGCHGINSLELARELLKMHMDEKGLVSLTRLSLQELTGVTGIGSVKAVQLQCIGELARRIAKASAGERFSMNSPAAIAGYFMEDLRHQEQEEIHVALFDTKSHLLRATVVSRGTVNAAIVSPREIFLEALKYHAVYVVLLHNHPSGDPTPSREDLALTVRMREAGELLEIPLIDHIIIGDNRYVSFKERGYF